MKLSNKLLAGLAAGILVLAAGAAGLLLLMPGGGSQVVVTVDGQTFGTYDLHEDRTVRIAPEDGSWYNILQIRDGTAAVVESDCANQICVHTPPLTEDVIGIIVCLPHGVVVELHGVE